METSLMWLLVAGFILLALITVLFRLVRKHHLNHHSEEIEIKFTRSDLDDWSSNSEKSYQSLWSESKRTL